MHRHCAAFFEAGIRVTGDDKCVGSVIATNLIDNQWSCGIDVVVGIDEERPVGHRNTVDRHVGLCPDGLQRPVDTAGNVCVRVGIDDEDA